MSKGLSLAILLACTVGLSGCAEWPNPLASSSDQAPAASAAETNAASEATTTEASAKKAASAAADTEMDVPRISRIEAVESGQGSRISIFGATPDKYQVYQLDNPPRLLLTLPGMEMDPTVQPLTVDLPTVGDLFPSNTGDEGARLEITLKGDTQYEVQERVGGLDIYILSLTQEETSGATQIQDVRISESETGTRIQLLGSGTIVNPKAIRLNNPPRLVVDMTGLSEPVEPRHFQVLSDEVRTVRLGGSAGKARLLVELTDAQVIFELEEESGLPVILLAHQSADRTATQAALKTPIEEESTLAAGVEAVDFTLDGENALVRVRLSKTDVVVDSHQDGTNLIIDLEGMAIPQELIRRLDVSDFGSPVNTVDTYPQGDNARLVAALQDPSSRHEILQKGQEIQLKVMPASPSGASSTIGGTDGTTYTGKRISMDFKDIDVQNAFKLLAQISNLNIILSDTVTGTLTMRLVEVPWDQALDLMLEAKGLGRVQQGNVLRIAPLSEIQQNAQDRLQVQESNQQLDPLVTEMIPVSFASAPDIRTLLMEGDQTQGTRILSTRGTVSIDARTNTLIVKDSVTNLAKIREMVSKLDKPIPQVLIEARIVEMDRSSSMALGINWGFNYKNTLNNNFAISDSAANAYTTHQDATNTYERRASMSGNTAQNVSLMPSTTVGQIGLHMGSISPLLDLDIELGALETQGYAKTISSPRVLTTNNQLASINQGINQPYPTESESGGVTYAYIQADLSLEVTPQVTPNGYITLAVAATNNSLGSSSSVGAPPPINTKEVNTNVLVKNGETIVLGGIFQDIATDGNSAVPELHKIPFLGWLFKNKSISSSQTELLIFITPRIINPE
ncbi:MAG: type IV pilus secretin PilQ [Magnetococcales bacterium]|nr:type IV pilus secretin PilQ [Magnetococcales bacterium]